MKETDGAETPWYICEGWRFGGGWWVLIAGEEIVEGDRKVVVCGGGEGEVASAEDPIQQGLGLGILDGCEVSGSDEESAEGGQTQEPVRDVQG